MQKKRSKSNNHIDVFFFCWWIVHHPHHHHHHQILLNTFRISNEQNILFFSLPLFQSEKKTSLFNSIPLHFISEEEKEEKKHSDFVIIMMIIVFVVSFYVAKFNILFSPNTHKHSKSTMFM